jgi:hypothetical protein
VALKGAPITLNIDAETQDNMAEMESFGSRVTMILRVVKTNCVFNPREIFTAPVEGRSQTGH